MPKPALDLRSLARSYTASAVQTLGSIMSEKACPPSARVQAATVLLERGWGKAAQPITGEDGGEITIVIRRLMDEDAMKTVEGRVVKVIDQVVRQGDDATPKSED